MTTSSDFLAYWDDLRPLGAPRVDGPVRSPVITKKSLGEKVRHFVLTEVQDYQLLPVDETGAVKQIADTKATLEGFEIVFERSFDNDSNHYQRVEHATVYDLDGVRSFPQTLSGGGVGVLMLDRVTLTVRLNIPWV